MGTVIPIRRLDTFTIPTQREPHRQVPSHVPSQAPSPGPQREPLWRDLVGAFLRETRAEQHRILADVASAAGVSTQYLSEIERGRKEPSSEILGAVAEALGLTLHDIAAGVGAMIERRDGERMRRLSALRRSRPSSATAPVRGETDVPPVPDEPSAPGVPEAPEPPFIPSEPNGPGDPGAPDGPSEPDYPLTPTEPGIPIAPEPGFPGAPEEPIAPFGAAPVYVMAA
ncbi:helix-turn-helix domain-containing protein [Leifsonia flava]|uniref:Helix-turn-helix domain-containing protein n=1 Tax=Orlajensenia leifsoniae TaxID=2561933 RepID=A0A4Y9QTA0_9MICO|nr:helix-turn-helix transcriptional regulator [Leifsonia flava]TFV95367.1 helix-turn-helix domain-containing protein [Leifsonia flava]